MFQTPIIVGPHYGTGSALDHLRNILWPWPAKVAYVAVLLCTSQQSTLSWSQNELHLHLILVIWFCWWPLRSHCIGLAQWSMHGFASWNLCFCFFA